MKNKAEPKPVQKGLHGLYQEDPVLADKLVFGRESHPINRRGFIRGLSTMGAILGADIVYSQFMPSGLIPAAFAQSEETFLIPGKSRDLVVLNDRPINAETPAHLLDPVSTPADLLFVRNNGIPPVKPDPDTWTLTVEGESAKQSKSYSFAELKKRFKHHSYHLTIECGGNGRSEFSPPAKGNQWSTGAVGCGKWTGIRLADLLEDIGVKEDAVYLAYEGADTHLSGDPNKLPISRGVPITKALQPESLIAWAYNDKDLPLMNGFPLRLVFGGWPASTSGKWLNKLLIRNKVHDGPKMTGKAYRVPCNPVAPGTKVADEDMCIIHEMPVKSIITYPKSGVVHSQKEPLPLRGHAWAGDRSVKTMEVSIDFGQTWQEAEVNKAVNLNAWQQFTSAVSFPKPGYYEVWARATDDHGISQPMILPGWNPKGYLNNAAHRIAVKVV